jgi:hypothetical protein
MVVFNFMEQIEIWKDIPNYEGIYQVSNLGNVKSLGNNKRKKEKFLKQGNDYNGYKYVILCKKGNRKIIKSHQLVAIVFLNHVPCGYKFVVNHKNFIKHDNRLENLEIVTQRENSNKRHINYSSKFTGVCWHKKANKWESYITIDNKKKYLGLFSTEKEASKEYNKYLKLIK